MVEEQSMDSLQIQSAQAVEFIVNTWPKVREQARDVLEAMDGDIENVILCGCGDALSELQMRDSF